MESIGLQKPEDLFLFVFSKKQQMSRDPVPIIPRPRRDGAAESSSGDRHPVPITAESSSGNRHPVGTGLRGVTLERSETLRMTDTLFQRSVRVKQAPKETNSGAATISSPQDPSSYRVDRYSNP